MEQWRKAFILDPNQAIVDLFSGRAGLGSSMRLNLPELLHQEFPDSPEYSDARQQLDNALLKWLNMMRRDNAAQVKRLGYGVYGKRLCDALTSVQLLDLRLCTYHLRETASYWLNWLIPLRLSPERDPALEYWRVLTHRQSTDANPAPWLQLAMDSRPEYLSVALVGLQRLPNPRDNPQRNQQTQLLALLHHAVLMPDIAHASRFFNQQFAALRATYPAGPEHWRNLLESVIKGFKVQTTLAKDLLAKIQQPSKPRSHKSNMRSNRLQPASKEELDKLLDDIHKPKQSAEKLAQQLFKLSEKYYAYSQATGDSDFFVRTLSNVATQLLKRYQLSVTYLNQLQGMIEQALSLQPMNPYVWMLWATYLEYSGRHDAQQWVLQETTRLFPNNEPSRVELARLLMRQDKDEEAERLLREVVDRNSNNKPSCVILARLLIKHGEKQKAIELLSKFINQNPQKSKAMQILSSIQGGNIDALCEIDFDEENQTEQEQISASLMTNESGKGMLDPDNNQQFDNNSGTALTSEKLSKSVETNASHLTQLLNELQRRARLQSEFNQALGQSVDADYIRQETAQGDALASFYQQWLNPDENINPPPHAWAAHACRFYQTRETTWEHLDQTFPEYRLANRFLRIQASDDSSTDDTALLTKLSSEAKSLTPLQQFMHQALKTKNTANKDETVLTVLASAAVSAPTLLSR